MMDEADGAMFDLGMMDGADGAPGQQVQPKKQSDDPLALVVDRRIRDDNGNTAEMNRMGWMRSTETRSE
jgi:hypothetical protein